MATLLFCRDFLKQKWEQSSQSRSGHLQSIARPGPVRLLIFSPLNSQRTSALWNLNRSPILLATCYPIFLSLVRHYIYCFFLYMVLITVARNPGGNKTPQESTHPSPNINRLRKIIELLDEAITKRSQSALKSLVRNFYPWGYPWQTYVLLDLLAWRGYLSFYRPPFHTPWSSPDPPMCSYYPILIPQ